MSNDKTTVRLRQVDFVEWRKMQKPLENRIFNGTEKVEDVMVECESCDGDGIYYDKIEKEFTDCPVCKGAGEIDPRRNATLVMIVMKRIYKEQIKIDAERLARWEQGNAAV